MARIKLSYLETSRRYPKELREVIKKVRQSQSKYRLTRPENWKWFFDYSFTGKSMSLAEFMEKAARELETGVKEQNKPSTIEVCIGAQLPGNNGLCRRSSPLKEIPPELKNIHEIVI
jgi:hypothetical protein